MKDYGCKLFLTIIISSMIKIATAATVVYAIPDAINEQGCAPTAAACVLAEYALQGCSGLFDVTGNDLYQTDKIKLQISSTFHDNNPTIANTNPSSLADFMGTSLGSIGIGNTIPSNIPTGIVAYAATRGYTFQSTLLRLSTSSAWSFFQAELNAGRCPLAYIDFDGDGNPDHVVPVVGYDDNHNGNGPSIAFYPLTSADTTPTWAKFQGRAKGNEYGIYEEIQIIPPSLTVPEPSTDFIFIVIGASLAFRRRRAC